MSYLIEKDEGTAARRRVPCRIFLSNGTSPDTTGLNDAIVMGTNSLATFSVASTLREVNANQGMYCIELSQSEVSVLGTHPLYHTVGDFPQHIATIQVVNSNPMSTLSAISNVTLADKEYSAVTVRIGLVDYSGASVGARDITPRVYSGVSVEVKTGGIQTASVGKGNYSGVSVEVLSGGIQVASVGAGTYSGVTVGVNNIAAGSYSGVTIAGIINPISIWSAPRSSYTNPGTFGEYVYSQVTGTSTGTIQGVTRLNSGVTLNADTHSGATIAGIVAGGIIASTLASGVLTSAKFAAGAIDAAALATDAGQEIADAVLARNIAGGSSTGRIVSEALYALRNASLIQGSVGTVYQTDDSTSAWTFSPSLGTAPISGIDPTT